LRHACLRNDIRIFRLSRIRIRFRFRMRFRLWIFGVMRVFRLLGIVVVRREPELGGGEVAVADREER